MHMMMMMPIILMIDEENYNNSAATDDDDNDDDLFRICILQSVSASYFQLTQDTELLHVS